jgi:RNA polymerase sigma factor (sigma-70 family)
MDPRDDDALYRSCARDLTRFATALVGPSGAEDLVATSVARALGSRRWHEIDDRRGYLFRVVWNEAGRARRASQRRLEREIRVASKERIESAMSDGDVLRAIATLRIRQRAVVFLTYWSDLEPAVVAGMLGVSQRTVERELTSARRRLEVLLS